MNPRHRKYEHGGDFVLTYFKLLSSIRIHIVKMETPQNRRKVF